MMTIASERRKKGTFIFCQHDQWNGKNKISSVYWEESGPDSPTIPLSPGFSRFCLKILNPNQYAIGMGKIAILTSVLIFWMNSFDTYTRTPNRVYLIETDIQKTLKNRMKYKIRSSTCMQIT